MTNREDKDRTARVYEVRTGKLVAKTSVRVGGRSRPRRFNYTIYGYLNVPPDEAYVTSSTSDLRKAYRPLIRP